MKTFSQFLNRLFYTHSNLAKEEIMVRYFGATPDPERGYALAAITEELSFSVLKSAAIKDIVLRRIDETLFHLSYDYVGDLSETVALLWPNDDKHRNNNELPPLSLMIEQLKAATKESVVPLVSGWLDIANAEERWALIKMATGNLRIGVSGRSARKALATFGGVDISEVEEIWHHVHAPYLELFSWLENKSVKPDVKNLPFFRPMMLSHQLEDKELEDIQPGIFQAEWKWDGIRVQVLSNENTKVIYSRTGDDVSKAFPDIRDSLNFNAVLDGELLVKKNNTIATFNDLQQRLNRKTPSKKMMEEFPGHIRLYDILMLNGEDLRGLPLSHRRKILEDWYQKTKPPYFDLSDVIDFPDTATLQRYREMSRAGQLNIEGAGTIEGMMFKKLESPYIGGRPKGHWYKWKRDPFLIDAVLMYAQRGHGKRSSFYSDYTFGLWEDKKLLPVGKAYFGFTDEELKKLDKWVRDNTLNKFGPVREVKPEMVFEVAFDSVNFSKRHKSGVAMRFPRINRIRWDKPANEADELENLKKMIK